jgi:hypothetical protein
MGAGGLVTVSPVRSHTHGMLVANASQTAYHQLPLLHEVV